MEQHHVGVVVIGRNEGQRLIRCLTSIGKLTRNAVYVDSGSTDGSVAASIKAGVHIHELDRSVPFTASRARNEGFRVLLEIKPNIRYVQFLDGDCELVDSWMEAALSFIVKRDGIAIVCGRRRELYPDRSVYNYLCDIEWDTTPGEAAACGGDALVRVEAFQAVNGFRASLMAGEEPEMCLRLRERGWKIWRLNEEMTRHDAAITRLTQWWARSVRGGYGYAEITQLHRRSPWRIYEKELIRSIFWGGVLPASVVVITALNPIGLALALLYPFQVCRIAFRRGARQRMAWIFAGFVTLAKFAELQGAMTYWWRRYRKRAFSLIEYK